MKNLITVENYFVYSSCLVTLDVRSLTKSLALIELLSRGFMATESYLVCCNNLGVKLVDRLFVS